MHAQEERHTSAHSVFTVHTDSMMYGFYLANAKSFSQMIASGAAVLRVTRPLLSWLVTQFKKGAER